MHENVNPLKSQLIIMHNVVVGYDKRNLIPFLTIWLRRIAPTAVLYNACYLTTHCFCSLNHNDIYANFFMEKGNKTVH